MALKKLDYEFYNRTNVVKIAKELIGKLLVTRFDGIETSGRIVETEAYNGIADRASHAWNNRRTNRTEIMFGDAGMAYVYLCYGIHHLFNIVTNEKDIPNAVLIRAIEPVTGINIMLERTGKKKPDRTLGSGPGNVAKALGIFTKHTGINLLDDLMFVADDNFKVTNKDVLATPRIGVDYAGEDALLPYRFVLKGNIYVSGRKLK
ncbi:DNA-3-methyladenine glycosylase [Terrimonas sp.]|uniref:DNA-3-methyladenine glycosylase n=1 Tax=Terrimonas sp. TaxID=1914338 RepID=UPI000D51C85E|nr:DNA-3-methyladenine glycosylase [Terrimonas sp.]PVD51034.1 DNA-3-methyladenine glycosylase [Terrimonas sp.]